MYWILDPEIDGTERRNRAISELLRSASSHSDTEEALLDALSAHDIPIVESHRYGYHAGEEVPTSTKLVGELGVDYHSISMLAHAEALGRVLMQSTSEIDGTTRVEIRAKDIHLFDLYGKLLTAIDGVIGRWAEYTGWSRSGYDAARAESITKMRTSAHMP